MAGEIMKLIKARVKKFRNYVESEELNVKIPLQV